MQCMIYLFSISDKLDKKYINYNAMLFVNTIRQE